jgi:transposase
MGKLLIAVDLAKDVFELAVATADGHVQERKRLTRAQFERFWASRTPCQVVMEACGSAHHWARHLIGLGFEVTLLPARYVRLYRQRNKTDRVDCDALLEAFRSPRIKPVAVKSRDQQAILALHRGREQWKSTRTMRINVIRGFLREFGDHLARRSPASAPPSASPSASTQRRSRRHRLPLGAWTRSERAPPARFRGLGPAAPGRPDRRPHRRR